MATKRITPRLHARYSTEVAELETSTAAQILAAARKQLCVGADERLVRMRLAGFARALRSVAETLEEEANVN